MTTDRRGKSNVVTDTRTGVMWPHQEMKEGSHQKLDEARNIFSPGASGGGTVLPHFDLSH